MYPKRFQKLCELSESNVAAFLSLATQFEDAYLLSSYPSNFLRIFFIALIAYLADLKNNKKIPKVLLLKYLSVLVVYKN